MFWVAELIYEKYPAITSMEHFDDKEKAIARVLELAKEHETEESEETIRKELDHTGHYREGKYSEWAIAFGEVLKEEDEEGDGEEE